MEVQRGLEDQTIFSTIIYILLQVSRLSLLPKVTLLFPTFLHTTYTTEVSISSSGSLDDDDDHPLTIMPWSVLWSAEDPPLDSVYIVGADASSLPARASPNEVSLV